MVLVGGFTVMRVRTFFGAGGGTGITSAKVDDTKPFDGRRVHSHAGTHVLRRRRRHRNHQREGR
ncbi:hypothetical protein H7J34_16760 [Mycolicibacterium alvei]|nr:hypothetical protein [Mycolicibacterium alvei]